MTLGSVFGNVPGKGLGEGPEDMIHLGHTGERKAPMSWIEAGNLPSWPAHLTTLT